MIGRTAWGPTVPALKGTEASLSYVQCSLYLVSSSTNVSFSYYMARYLLDIWTNLGISIVVEFFNHFFLRIKTHPNSRKNRNRKVWIWTPTPSPTMQCWANHSFGSSVMNSYHLPYRFLSGQIEMWCESNSSCAILLSWRFANFYQKLYNNLYSSLEYGLTRWRVFKLVLKAIGR